MDNIHSSYDQFREASFGPPYFGPPQFKAYAKAGGPTATGYPVQETPPAESRAFLPDRSPRHSSFSARNYIRRIPWLGLGALAASGVTVMLSLTILLIVNHHVVWPNTGWSTFMRPASWLSALLSANGIFLHFALEEGLTIAWWYRASKPDATVRELHDAWHHGTSLPAALFAGRKITYISMATIFCALLPLNGFLLQGAITTILSEEVTEILIRVPMVETLPPGYSGTVYPDGNMDVLGTAFSDTWVQVLNLGASPNSRYAYGGTFVNYTDHNAFYGWGCENSSICTTTALGAGFNVTCDASTIPYDLFPHPGMNFSHGLIFNTDIWWDRAQPNVIGMDLIWKDDTSCIGYLEHRNCTAQAAIMEYPVQLQMNISSTNIYPGPYVSLVSGTTRNDDVLQKILPVHPGDGVNETIFGGIAVYFRNYFNSQMNISTWPDHTGTYWPSGQLCTSLSPAIAENQHDKITDWNGYCNMSFEFPLQIMKNQQLRDGSKLNLGVEYNYINYSNPVDLADVILEPLRQSMFFASVYQGFSWYGVTAYDPGPDVVKNETVFDQYIKTRPATQVTPVSRYVVRFYLWGASLAVTYCIILFLIPLFWGFWTLKRKPTMSPVDVARAFKAPLLSEYEVETKTLLRHHGRKSIHHDLVSSPDSFRRESGGSGYFEMNSPRSQQV